MPETFKQFYQGQLPTSPSQLFTAGTGKQLIVKHIQVINTDQAYEREFTLWMNGTGNQNLLLPATRLLPGGYGSFEGTITMAPGGSFYGSADLANKVTINLFGMEIS